MSGTIQNIFGSVESVVLPVGSDAAWEAILRVRKVVCPTHYHEHRICEPPPPPKPVESPVIPCVKCGQLIRKPDYGTRDFCPHCSIEARRERRNEWFENHGGSRNAARDAKRLRGAA